MARRAPRPSRGPRVRWAHVVSAAVIAGGGAYLVGGAPLRSSRGAVALPALEERAAAGGAVQARLDHAALAAAFARAGLPEPPDLNGADPVPVRALLDAAGAWMEERDPADLGRLGRIFQALEEHEPALGCFAAAAALDPEDPRWVYFVGVECQALGLDGAASAALEASARREPGYPTTWARLGLLRLERGDLDGAAQAYAAYVRLEPQASLGPLGLGRVALARGAPAEAERLFRAAAAASPNDHLAFRFLARALSALGREEEARAAAAHSHALPAYSGWTVFDERLRESQLLADTQASISNEMRRAMSGGDLELVALHAERLLVRRPDDFNALRNLASVLRGLGRLDEADAAIGRAHALRPGSVDVHNVRAEISFARRDFDGAGRALDRALEIDPASPRAWELRGRTLFMQGRAGEAAEAMERAIALDPADDAPRLALAEMRRLAGDRAGAAAALRSLLERNPDHAEARRLLEAVGGGSGLR